MNRKQKSPKSSKQAPRSGSSAITSAETEQSSGQTIPINDQSDPRGGGPSKVALVRSSKLIEPEKKCDKGDYREDELADRIGLARQYLRNFREKYLTEDIEWFFIGRAVVWRSIALDGLLKFLRLDIDEIPGKAPPHLLQVKKMYTNIRLLGCVDPDGSEDVLNMVWVKNSKMFNLNQLIPAEFQGNRMVLACRQPRIKGKIK